MSQAETHDRPVSGGGARRWVQGVGFVLGMTLLGWCIWRVLGDERQLAEAKRLAQSPGTLAGLVALSIGVSLCTGMMFHAMLRPVARLPIADVLAVNAVSTLLNNLPFKLSLVARFYLHRTRNRLPVPLIVAWMGAALGVMAVGVLPPMIATLILQRVDWVWWGVVIVSTVLLAAGAVGFARVTGTDRFWGWVERMGERLPGTLGRLTRWSGFADIKRGPVMLGNIPAVSQGVAWRTGSAAFGVWRFWVASMAIAAGGTVSAMTLGQCVVADSVYFSIQATAPTGALGAREGGTVAALAAVAGESLPVVVLAVTAAETAANLLCAGVGLVYLRLRKGRGVAEFGDREADEGLARENPTPGSFPPGRGGEPTRNRKNTTGRPG